jgi:hypothetical protein
MRGAAIAILFLAGCSLDVGSGDDETDIDDVPTGACDLGAQYRSLQNDCGLLPPDSPPAECYWTIRVDAATQTIQYCYSDVCDSLRYECDDAEITAVSDGGWSYRGELVSEGTLLWTSDGSTYVFEPY